MSDYSLTLRIENESSVQIEQANVDSQQYTPGFTPLRKQTIKVFETWLAKDQITERNEVEVLGTHLYEALFPNEKVRQFLKNMYQEASKAQKRLRLQLRFDQGAELLAGWPWEFLYYPDPDVQDFFAILSDLVLTRYVPKPGTKIPDSLAPEKSPLKILVVVSQPPELDPVYATPVKEEIKELEKTQKVEVHELDNPTMEEWTNSLEQFKPHIVHWIGHGRVNQKKEAEVALVDEERKLVWCLDMIFARKFKEVHSIPRLVVLQMCESGSVKSEGFSGVAPWLVQVQVPAVVAMQYPIKQKAAIAFSRVFYESLAKGEDVDDAFQIARKRMAESDLRFSYLRDIGTPVLYWRSRSGIILRADESAQQVQVLQTRSSSESSSGVSWTPEARRIWKVGANEISNSNLDPLEKLAMSTELQKLCVEFSQYRDLFDIEQKLIELSGRTSNPHLVVILMKMIEECRK
jgi:hypothetical protein